MSPSNQFLKFVCNRFLNCHKVLQYSQRIVAGTRFIPEPGDGINHWHKEIERNTRKGREYSNFW